MSDEYDDHGPYPSPPAVGLTPETWEASTAAAAHIEPSAETLRAAVRQYIVGQTHAGVGATDGEIQIALDMEGNTERPRRWELYQADEIYSKGTRVNANGRKCAVWWAVGVEPPDALSADAACPHCGTVVCEHTDPHPDLNCEHTYDEI